MLLLGYVLFILNYICYCSSRYCKEKKYMLTLELVAKILTIISMYCFGSLSGAYIFIVGFVNIIVRTILEYKELDLKFLFFVFEFLYIVITVITLAGVSSILVFTSSSISLFSLWFLPPQKMRVVGIYNSFIHLFYQLSIKNYAGFLECFVILSNLTSYLKYKRSGLTYQVNVDNY